jgi:hypothetical protein
LHPHVYTSTTPNRAGYPTEIVAVLNPPIPRVGHLLGQETERGEGPSREQSAQSFTRRASSTLANMNGKAHALPSQSGSPQRSASRRTRARGEDRDGSPPTRPARRSTSSANQNIVTMTAHCCAEMRSAGMSSFSSFFGRSRSRPRVRPIMRRQRRGREGSLLPHHATWMRG